MDKSRNIKKGTETKNQENENDKVMPEKNVEAAAEAAAEESPEAADEQEPAKQPKPQEQPPKTFRKTYGIRGLMACRLQLATGSPVQPHIAVTFEGGQITGYGVAPARFVTADSVIQQLIETHKWFIENRITLLSSAEVMPPADDGKDDSQSQKRDENQF